MRRWAWSTGLALVAACGGEPLRYGQPAWPDEHAVVVLPVDEALRPVDAPRLFAPGAPVTLQVDADVARVVVLTYGEGQDALLTCGVRLDGDREPLPAPDGAFQSSLLSADALTFTPLSGAFPQLHYDVCDPPPDPCPTITTEVFRVPGLADQNLTAIAVPTHGEVLLSTSGLLNGPRIVTWSEAGVGALDLPVGDPTRGFEQLVPVPEGMWATQGPEAWLVDAQGQVVETASVPFGIQQLVVDPSGPVLVRNGTEGGMVDLTGALPPLEELVLGLLADGPDTTFALAWGTLERLEGGAWSTVRNFGITESWRVLGGDRRIQVMGNGDGETLIRQPDGTWLGSAQPPAEAFKIRSILPMSANSFIVGGNDGGVAVHTGTRWCMTPRSVVNVLTVGAADPDGRTFYFSTGEQGDVLDDDALLVRVTVDP
ncbi:MAG: hypothetical protein KC933_23965 [Myxococcales bacterium]|nr:hypothetical protein [Myxococcales bacterium]